MPSSWSFAEPLARRAGEHAARTCIVARGRTLTHARGEARAASLAVPGVGAGDRIAIDLPDSPAWVIAMVAAVPGETARSFSPDGCVLTGDVGVLEEDSRLRVTGRADETILRGGFQVSPREIEDQLRAHPAVGDVRVIGIPDEELGERICACVVPVEGAAVIAEELRDFARDTMADHEIPDIVRFFEAFPTTGTGRPKRRDLEPMIVLETTLRPA
jgi:acyl-CoA synthetase (AMP-forming)/AMP-acid ligase II